VIEVSPAAGQAIQLNATLYDDESPFAHTNLGDEVSVNAFETGWRKEVTLRLTGGGSIVRVIFSLEPI
jgi:hypothetical protein